MSSDSSQQTYSRSDGFIVDDFNQGVLRRPGSSHMNVDKTLSQKLNNMSLEERTEGIQELHGVADDDAQNMAPEIFNTKLEEMTRLADTLPETTSKAYRLALKIDKGYVERIQLLCLRADKYDTEKASRRMAAFFTFKQQLFGDDTLAHEIALEDFDEDDRKGLNAGIVQVLQERDRAGRAIIIMFGAVSEYNLSTGLRVFYYVFMTTLRDLEIQNKGIVLILYTIGTDKFHSDRPGKFAQCLQCVPMRLVSVHVCCNSKLMDLLANMLCHRLESQLLCRFRCHQGTYLECMYALMTFGIPKHVLPFHMETGAMDLKLHHEWLDTLQARENAKKTKQQLPESNNSTGDQTTTIKANNDKKQEEDEDEIVIPGPMDIIVGNKSRSRTSPGYLRVRHLIETQHAEYEKAGKAGKTKIANRILQESRGAGCRYLRWTPEGLVKCNDVQAREKISHAFRNMRRRQPPSENNTDGREKAGKHKLPPIMTSQS